MHAHLADRLTAAFGLLRMRRLQEAEAACRDVLAVAPQEAAALHLLGLIRKEAGDLQQGEQLLRASIRIEPRRGEFHVNLANLLQRQGRLSEAEESYRRAVALDATQRSARLGLARVLNALGRYADAEAECRRLVAAHDGDAQAWSTLGSALRGQQKLEDAIAAYRRALTIAPNYGLARHNLGALLSQMEQAESALLELERAASLGVRGRELAINRGRALMQLYRLEEAERSYGEAVAAAPSDPEAHFRLAELRFMRGDPQFARDLAAAVQHFPDDIKLQLTYGDLLCRVGDRSAAEAVLWDARRRFGNRPEICAALAVVLHETGRLQEAELECREALVDTTLRAEAGLVERLVAIQLALGKIDEARSWISEQRARWPHEQRWIAYEATAARAAGDPLYQRLYDYDRLVQIYDLEPPVGWGSVAALNEALVGALGARHAFATHPLDQSLRHGSQTARSLLTDPDPAIRALLDAFRQPLARYCEALGSDPEHPMSARNTGSAKIVGCWSVQLRSNGFHVNHVHPQGWLSSAYYVAVPEEVGDEDRVSGWLKFGEPRYPVPGCGPERHVQPRAGRIVLFPSYMWHGTNPIHGSVPRITVAFDALPQIG